MPTFNNANRRLASLVFILFVRQNIGDVDDIQYIEFFFLSISLVRQTCECISLFLSLYIICEMNEIKEYVPYYRLDRRIRTILSLRSKNTYHIIAEIEEYVPYYR